MSWRAAEPRSSSLTLDAMSFRTCLMSVPMACASARMRLIRLMGLRLSGVVVSHEVVLRVAHTDVGAGLQLLGRRECLLVVKPDTVGQLGCHLGVEVRDVVLRVGLLSKGVESVWFVSTFLSL